MRPRVFNPLRPLFVKLTDDDREALDKIVVDAIRQAGRPLTTADVVRALIRQAAKSRKPVEVEL